MSYNYTISTDTQGQSTKWSSALVVINIATDDRIYRKQFISYSYYHIKCIIADKQQT